MDYENIDQFGYEIIMGFKLSAARRHWEVSVIPADLNTTFCRGSDPVLPYFVEKLGSARRIPWSFWSRALGSIRYPRRPEYADR